MREFSNPFWDSNDGSDDQPSPARQARIRNVQKQRMIAEIVGPWVKHASVMLDEKMYHFTIWAPHKRIAVERLPKEISASDDVIVQRAEKLRAMGITYLVFVHGEVLSVQSLRERLAGRAGNG
jgi:hypothetical protein